MADKRGRPARRRDDNRNRPQQHRRAGGGGGGGGGGGPHRPRGPAHLRRSQAGPKACPMCGAIVSDLKAHIHQRHDDAQSHPRQ